MTNINQLVLETISNPNIDKRFLIHQHHINNNTHYDIRIENEGSLTSFVCQYLPELISDEKKKILILEQKLHEIPWFNFNDKINKKYIYKNSTMLLWDKGLVDKIKWTPNSKVIKLNGQKIKETFAMIPYMNKKNQYLMFKTKS